MLRYFFPEGRRLNKLLWRCFVPDYSSVPSWGSAECAAYESLHVRCVDCRVSKATGSVCLAALRSCEAILAALWEWKLVIKLSAASSQLKPSLKSLHFKFCWGCSKIPDCIIAAQDVRDLVLFPDEQTFRKGLWFHPPPLSACHRVSWKDTETNWLSTTSTAVRECICERPERSRGQRVCLQPPHHWCDELTAALRHCDKCQTASKELYKWETIYDFTATHASEQLWRRSEAQSRRSPAEGAERNWQGTFSHSRVQNLFFFFSRCPSLNHGLPSDNHHLAGSRLQPDSS